MLATFSFISVSAAFLGGSPAPALQSRTAARIAAAPTARRCPAPYLMASNSDGGDASKGPNFGDDGPVEQWSVSDDAALAEFMSMRSSQTRCGRPDTVLSGVPEAWVLIFNLGRQDEGVYTLQGRASRTSAYVLAFEQSDDADRFAQLLQADSFDGATPLRWDSGQLTAFCDAGEFEVSLVPQGALITPPSKNEYDQEAFERMHAEASMGSGEGSIPSEEYPDAYASQRSLFEKLYEDGPSMP